MKKSNAKKTLTKAWLFNQYWVEKKSLKEIAKLANVSDQTIFRHLQKHNIPRRNSSKALKNFFQKTPLLEQQKERLRKLGNRQKIFIPKDLLKKLYWVEKKSTTEIAKIFNCSPPTVSSRLREMSIPLRTKSARKVGDLNPSWGKKQESSFKWRKFHSKQTRIKISQKVPSGKMHFRWKPPEKRLEPINNQIRNCSKMKMWKLDVFKRDNFTCQICSKKRSKVVQINADHIVPFAKIRDNNNISSLEDALLCKELWDISNGRTLCVDCHRETDTWGFQK